MGELRPFARRDGRESPAFGGASLPQGLSANDHEPTSTERARQILWVLVGLFAIESAAGLDGLRPGQLDGWSKAGRPGWARARQVTRGGI